jgi:hypothetical protein
MSAVQSDYEQGIQLNASCCVIGWWQMINQQIIIDLIRDYRLGSRTGTSVRTSFLA